MPAFFIDCPNYTLNTIPSCSPRKSDLEHLGSEGVPHVGTDCVVLYGVDTNPLTNGRCSFISGIGIIFSPVSSKMIPIP